MLKLVSSNEEPTAINNQRPDLWSEEYVVHLMKRGELMLYREEKTGFIYMKDSYGDILSINQQLAKNIIKNPVVYQERWKEGWSFVKETGLVRWRAD